MIAAELATQIGGTVLPNDGDPRVLVADGFVYSNFQGRVRLQRNGHPVVTLGGVSDDVDVLAGAFFAAVGVTA